jgi:hypothetical protein
MELIQGLSGTVELHSTSPWLLLRLLSRRKTQNCQDVSRVRIRRWGPAKIYRPFAALSTAIYDLGVAQVLRPRCRRCDVRCDVR